MHTEDQTVKLTQEDIYGWPGYRMSVGDISLGITPQIGGRIISLTHKDEELFFAQDEHKGEIYNFENVADLKSEKKRLGFRLWGGDKTWVSPQGTWWEKIPPLEIDAGQYTFTKVEELPTSVTLEMTSLVCRETNLQVTRCIQLRDDESIHLKQTFCNHANEDVRLGIWNVTQMLRPFNVYFPTNKSKIRAYKDEGLIEDAEAKITENNNWVKICCDDNTHFKFGGALDFGVSVALRNYHLDVRQESVETLAFVKLFDIDYGASYAHDAVAEVYNSPKYNYLELEVHAPFYVLKKGEEYSHSQAWRIGRLEGDVTPKQALEALTKGYA